MKKFNFESKRFFENSKDAQEYLIKNHALVISEDEFMEWWASRSRKNPDGSKILHASKKRSLHKGRKTYHRLVNNFGFFTGKL